MISIPSEFCFGRSDIFLSVPTILVFLYQILNVGKVMLFCVDDQRCLPRLRIAHGVDFGLHLVVILAIEMTVHYCLKEVLFVYIIGHYKFLVYCR